MSKPWRFTALGLFAASLLFGGLVGDRLLALSSEDRKALSLYTEVLKAAHDSYGGEIEYRQLVYGSVQGMLRTLDPHSSFLSPEAYEDMRERQQGSFYGLGILVSMRNGLLTVINPIEGTPAWRLGLRAGDVISSIEGEPTDGMVLDDAVDRLKGPKDTQVNITIVRPGLEEPLDLAITRAEIPQSTVRYAYMMDDQTGYIRLTDFSRSTAREMSDALDTLKAQGMNRLLLDLRSNGGGLLDQTVAVSNLIVPAKSRIVETHGRVAESHQTYYAESSNDPLEMPVVVLVNNGTASAAEILAGAVQDHDIGLVAGTPTWGKGLVQTVYNLSYGAALALTTAKYYTPSGRLIQRDYTSYYDYYISDRNEVEAEVEAPEVQRESPEFDTDLGRKVYGGGGITPDHIVELEASPPLVQILFSRNAFFNFAVERQNRAPVTSQSWEPDDEMLQQLREWLAEKELLTSEQLEEFFADEKSLEFSKRQIQSDLFNAAFGPEASHRVLARGDEQIQKAMALFVEARELLARRQELEGIDLPDRISSPESGAPTARRPFRER